MPQAALRRPQYRPTTGEPIYANLTVQIGSTWGDYSRLSGGFNMGDSDQDGKPLAKHLTKWGPFLVANTRNQRVPWWVLARNGRAIQARWRMDDPLVPLKSLGCGRSPSCV
jgi:hypothetical protein